MEDQSTNEQQREALDKNIAGFANKKRMIQDTGAKPETDICQALGAGDIAASIAEIANRRRHLGGNKHGAMARFKARP